MVINRNGKRILIHKAVYGKGREAAARGSGIDLFTAIGIAYFRSSPCLILPGRVQ